MYKEKPCRKCGTLFTPNSGHQTVCTPCREYVCIKCGKHFMEKNPKRKSRFCSPECYLTYRWGEESRKESLICPVCGITFFKHHDKRTKNRFCSIGCRDKWRSMNVRGIRHPRFKGKIRYGTDNRYWAILSPYHPFCDGKGYVFEHRLIMEKSIKRFLAPGEIVHHINRNTLDNDISNLCLMEKVEHDRLHTQERWDTNSFIR